MAGGDLDMDMDICCISFVSFAVIIWNESFDVVIILNLKFAVYCWPYVRRLLHDRVADKVYDDFAFHILYFFAVNNL